MRDERAVPEMHAVKNPDREVDRPWRPSIEAPPRFHAVEYQSVEPTPTGDGSATDTGVITGGAGSFTVSGSHTYREEGSYPVTVTIADVDNADNTATANSTANVASLGPASAR